MPRKSCAPHKWQRAKDPRFERCAECKTWFPCRRAGCGHADCHYVRGDPVPEDVQALLDALGGIGVVMDTSKLTPWPRDSGEFVLDIDDINDDETERHGS